MKKLLLFSFIILFSFGLKAVTYNWNGSVSSNWADATNWTPNGIPGAGDDVVILASSNNCLLDINRTIDALTITSGTIDLNNFQLNVGQNATFTSGNANNGTLNVVSSPTNNATFNGTTFSSTLNLNVIAGRIILNAGIFDGIVNFEQTGATNSGSAGNATFNNKFSFTLSGSGYFRTNGNNTFNDSTTFINNGSNYILFELTTGSTYNGFLRLINNSTANIRVAYQGNSHFYNNIEFNNTSTGRIQFGEQATASVTLHNGVNLNLGSLGFTNGQLLLNNITQTDATPQNLSLGGTYSYLDINDCHWLGDINFISPQIVTNNSIYDGITYIEKTDSTANYSGGNTFNSNTTITNSSPLNSLRFGRTNPDIFNGDLTLNNTNNGQIRIADNSLGNQINGKLTIINNSSNEVYVCNESPSSLIIDGDIELNQTSSSTLLYIGNTGNTVTQTAGHTITIGGLGVNVGTVRFTNFNQQDVNPINLNFTGTASFISRGSNWTGNLTIAASQLTIDTNVFNGNLTLNKTGTNNNTSYGGNKFLGSTTIINSGSAHLYFANVLPDSVMSSLSLITSGTGRIYLAHNSLNNLFNGNISINYITNANIYFGIGSNSSSELANGRTIAVIGTGVSGAGDLYIGRFTQVGATPQNIILNGTATLFLGPAATFNGNLTAVAPQLYLQESTYNGISYFEKNGAGNNSSAGGNRFNNTTTIVHSGSNNLLFGNTAILPDSFNLDLTATNTGTGQIYFAHTASNNYFGGNIILNSIGGNGVRFGENGGSSTILSGKTISIGGTGFSEGVLRLRNFTQLGATPQNLTLTSNGYLVLQETVWNGNVNFISPRLYTRGSTFNGTTYLEKTGATNDDCAGANTFQQTSTLKNSGSGYLRMGTTAADIFNNDVTITNTGTYYILMADASAGNQFNGNIVVNATSGTGVNFGRNNGTATLAATKTVTVGGLGFNSGELRFRNFTQVGATAQNITLTGTGYILNQTSLWNGNVTFIAPRNYTATSTYNGTVYFEKNGASDDDSYGGNVFNQITSIVNSGTGRIRMGTTAADIFNNDVIITNTGTNYILMADASAGNQFNGNIVVNATSGTGVNFGRNNGTATLAATKTVTVGGLGFNSGELRFRNFTQVGATTQNITLTGTGYFLNQSSNWGGNVSFIAPRFYTESTNYNGTAYIEKNGAINDDSYGANTFQQTSTLKNTGTGRIRMGTTAADIFNNDVIITNTGTNYILMADASAGNQFNGNIVVNATSGTGVNFGATNGTATLAATKTVTVGGLGFNSGELRFRNFTQVGATAQNITLTGSGYFISQSSNWGGNVSFIAPRFYTEYTNYNGTAYLEKNGASNDASLGGNNFAQNVEFLVSGTGYFMPSNTVANTFMADVTYRKTGTGAMYPTYSAASIYNGNIFIESNSTITFGANTGRVIFEGSASQQINDLGTSPTPIFRRLTTNKTGGEVTLNIPIAVSTDLNLVSRNIISNATNLLIMYNGSSVSSVSNTSFVEGPVRKVGNTAFTFPIGKNGYYRPASITNPSNVAHHFTAEYFLTSPDNSGYNRLMKEATIDHLSDCEYWIIDRTNGASNVNVTLSWDTTSCGVTNLTDLKVARWDGSQWRDHGNGGTTGGLSSGTVISSSAITSFSPFTLASSTTANPLPITLLRFNALQTKNEVTTSWATSTEINNNFFTIERSTDIANWEEIATIKGAGNSYSTLNYSFVDENPFFGVSYYRLKQTDFDGSFSYSNIESVNFKSDIEFNVYPNPVKEVLNIKVSSSNNYETKVISSTGQLVYQGNNNLIETKNWANGIYQVIVVDGNEILFKTKIIKNN